jgi:hypothetical protein
MNDEDQNGYTLGEIYGFCRENAKKRARLKKLIAQAEYNIEADFGDYDEQEKI